MPTQVDVTQIGAVQLNDSPIAAVQVQVEAIPPVELIPIQNIGAYGIKFSKILGSVLTETVLQAEHGLTSAIGVFLLKPDGNEASVQWQIAGTTINIYSNVNLLNHKLIIF
jgi:hypothetical protein